MLSQKLGNRKEEIEKRKEGKKHR